MGGSILAPLLNRQALNAQVDISQSQRNQALYSYEKTVRNAFAEVNDSLDAITRYQEQLTELLAQQAVAQKRCGLRKTATATGTLLIWMCSMRSARCSRCRPAWYR